MGPVEQNNGLSDDDNICIITNVYIRACTHVVVDNKEVWFSQNGAWNERREKSIRGGNDKCNAYVYFIVRRRHRTVAAPTGRYVASQIATNFVTQCDASSSFQHRCLDVLTPRLFSPVALWCPRINVLWHYVLNVATHKYRQTFLRIKILLCQVNAWSGSITRIEQLVCNCRTPRLRERRNMHNCLTLSYREALKRRSVELLFHLSRSTQQWRRGLNNQCHNLFINLKWPVAERY